MPANNVDLKKKEHTGQKKKGKEQMNTVVTIILILLEEEIQVHMYVIPQNVKLFSDGEDFCFLLSLLPFSKFSTVIVH